MGYFPQSPLSDKMKIAAMSLVPAATAPFEDKPLVNGVANGRTGKKASRRTETSGPNSMPDTSSHPARRAIEKIWAPIPWMLEAATLSELVLGKYIEPGIIAVLLLFNAALGFFQEGRAQATLATLKKNLALTASARRDGAWKNLPAGDLVPGDILGPMGVTPHAGRPCHRILFRL